MHKIPLGITHKKPISSITFRKENQVVRKWSGGDRMIFTVYLFTF